MGTKLWYRQPAKSFSESLPIGNGNLGAMVYGGYEEERLSLNSDTLWSGYPKKDRNLVRVPEDTLNRARELIFRGEYYQAEQLMKEKMLGTWNESYVAMGNLRIRHINPSPCVGYRRELNLAGGIAVTDIETEAGGIHREVFASADDHAIIMNIISEGNPLSLEITLESSLKNKLSQGENGALLLFGIAPSHVEPNYVPAADPIRYDEENKGIRFCIQADISETDGKIIRRTKSIGIREATRLTLILTGENGFRGYKNDLETSYEVLENICNHRYKLLKNKLYQQLKDNHLFEHNRLFGRVQIDLYEDPALEGLPADERLMRLKRGEKDKGLIELLFQYGRYLLICSSRDNGNFTQPPNLQGIWCEDVRSVWSSNWTTNINLEMNYWLSGVCNLSECDLPLIRMLEELTEAGEATARESLHCGGFAVNHNVDLWRQTAQVGGEVKYAFWPMAGVWLCSHLYQHYLYTRDLLFLKERALPVMKASAAFCLDWLILGEDGFLHTCPSTSPENTFYDKDGQECSVSYSSTMDIALIKELFLNLIEICNILDTEKGLVKQMKEALGKMPEYRAGSQGQLQEWIRDFEECDSGHRHFAHLAGFHPFAQINRRDTPELVAAVEKTIERRIENRKIHIGWNCAWLVSFYARLGYADRAENCLDQLLCYSVYDNLFDLHPPLGENDGEKEIFQIDGNFGAAAGIAEMLIQSHLGTISFLPALPLSWDKGKVTGLRVRGGAEVDMEWERGKLTRAVVRPITGQELCLEYTEYFQIYRNGSPVEGTYEELQNKKFTKFKGTKVDIFTAVPGTSL